MRAGIRGGCDGCGGVVSGEPSVAQLLRLVRDLVDDEPCQFDHHGGCQAHGFLSLEPGELCPHAEAKALLAAYPAPG